jgi:MYXO-CTERM domain-containing protein
MLGVESAFSAPSTVYLAVYGITATIPTMLDPILVGSTDGGGHWTGSALAPALGENGFRIIAVDRVDPLRLFLRVTEALDEKLAVSIDGGKTFQEPVTVDDKLTSFVRLASGTVLVGGSSNGAPVGFRSIDDGATFQPWPTPPHLRAMAERAGKLFVAADNFLDHFAVGVSSDEGLTFQPLLTYDQVKAIKPCLQQTCRAVCGDLADLTLWPAQVCGGDGDTSDAGSPGRGGGAGCGCRASEHGDDGAPATAAALVLALAHLLVRRSRGRSRRR